MTSVSILPTARRPRLPKTPNSPNASRNLKPKSRCSRKWCARSSASFRTQTTPRSLSARSAVWSGLPRRGVTGKLSTEQPLPLQINHLPRLAEREGYGVFESREGVGADETMLLERARDFPLDGAGGLILTFILELRGGEDEPFIFDGLGGYFGGAAAAVAAEQS